VSLPWYRAPVDAREIPGVSLLRPEARWTYITLFGRARRRPKEKLGWILDELGDPPTIRTLAAWLALPRSTAQRHQSDLLDRGLLVRDLAGRLIVPAVVKIERLLDSRKKETTPAKSASPTTTSAVENPTPEQLGLPTLVPPEIGKAPTWDTHSISGFVEVEKDVRPVVFEGAVENPSEPATFGPRRDLIPTACDPDSQIAYLLAQLASMHEPWERALSNRRDAANIGRLAVAHPDALYEALAQESLKSTAKNPTAWLNATVARRAESREATA
jgi:hypothetical protein